MHTTLIYLNIGGNSFTTAPTETAILAKLTAEGVVLRLTDTSPCSSADDVGMSGLTVTPGTLNPAFTAPGDSIYTLNVPQATETVTIVPTPRSSLATLSVSSSLASDSTTEGIQFDLTLGRNPAVPWKVTSEDQSESAKYQVNIVVERPPAAVTRCGGWS
ncbi:MAG: cadherin-like beta sandwich domain-containing protein [Chloroflexi bacterium]|nr:cadherin-like beta sandwich domain-containing protein [Chloroflexota bacterium]